MREDTPTRRSRGGHLHSAECYTKNARGALVYTPCRADGLDRNLTNLNQADFEAGVGLEVQCGEP